MDIFALHAFAKVPYCASCNVWVPIYGIMDGCFGYPQPAVLLGTCVAMVAKPRSAMQGRGVVLVVLQQFSLPKTECLAS